MNIGSTCTNAKKENKKNKMIGEEKALLKELHKAGFPFNKKKMNISAN